MTVLLDTNVVSELFRKVPDPSVETWAAGLPLDSLFFLRSARQSCATARRSCQRSDAAKH